MAREICSQLDEMIDLGTSSGTKQPDSLLRVASALWRRSTTKSSDEYICVGHLLGLDLSRLDHPPSSFEEILKQVQVPEDLIYVPGPRIPRKGFRWAPASLLGSGVHELLSGDRKPAKIGGNGIVIEKASLLSLGDIRFQRDVAYVLCQNGRMLAETEIPKGTNDAVRPVFILFYDFFEVWARTPTVKAIVANYEVGQGDTNAEYASYLFDVTMLRMDNPAQMPRSPKKAQTIDVQYQPMKKWTID